MPLSPFRIVVDKIYDTEAQEGRGEGRGGREREGKIQIGILRFPCIYIGLTVRGGGYRARD